MFKKRNEARSSTASHYSKDFGKNDAIYAVDSFYGLKLSNDLSTASVSPIKLLCLFLLLTALFIKPFIRALNRKTYSACFWVMAIGATFVLYEVTLYPLLATMIYTRTSYPYLVVIPHCMASANSYRFLRKKEIHYLTSFSLAFFCNGFGGSIVSDFLMGLPVTAFGHPRIIPCYILGWGVINFSPFDSVYISMQNKSSFLHWFVMACDAVDTVTTPMGRISRSARELKNKVTAPLMAGLFAGAGGAGIRYGEQIILQGNQEAHQTLFVALEAAVWRTIGYSMLWWWLAVYKCEHDVIHTEINHCGTYNGSDLIRVIFICFHVLWTMLCATGIADSHPFVWISKIIREVIGAQIVNIFRLGPRPVEEKVEKKE